VHFDQIRNINKFEARTQTTRWSNPFNLTKKTTMCNDNFNEPTATILVEDKSKCNQ